MPKTIRDQVAAEIDRIGMSRSELARRVGVSKAQMIQWLNATAGEEGRDRRKMKDNDVEKIAAVLGMEWRLIPGG